MACTCMFAHDPMHVHTHEHTHTDYFLKSVKFIDLFVMSRILEVILSQKKAVLLTLELFFLLSDLKGEIVTVI